MSDISSSPVSPAEQKEIDRVAGLTDEQVLKETNHGKYGPGIVGKPLAARAATLLTGTAGGRFGPAIVDPEYARKQAAAKLAAPATEGDDDTEDGEDDDIEPEGDVDPTNLKDPRNPWSYVTLSGAKVLAQQAQVSHKPNLKRKELIAILQEAQVVPPPVPEPSADDKPDA
jgi:hypothetical protein